MDNEFMFVMYNKWFVLTGLSRGGVPQIVQRRRLGHFSRSHDDYRTGQKGWFVFTWRHTTFNVVSSLEEVTYLTPSQIVLVIMNCSGKLETFPYNGLKLFLTFYSFASTTSSRRSSWRPATSATTLPRISRPACVL